MKVKKFGLALLVAVLGVGLAVTAAFAKTDGVSKSTANAQVCVLLPDTKSSIRWESFDRPYLAKAFKAYGDSYSIVNAQGQASTQLNQAQQCLTNGAKVILLVNLDSGSGKAIEQLAKSRGAKSVDYDRLTLKGLASYYVSFDNVAVGKLQGAGVVAGLKANGNYSKKPVVAELNGSPTDNNATLFKQGYDSVLKPLYSNGTFKKGPDQSVPQWDNQKALTIFEQMLTATGNKIDAVLAANDGLANAVVSALKQRHLSNLPVTGQDATAQGIQHLLAGEQCMTVYKAVKAEADAAGKLAIALAKGQSPTTNGSTDNKGSKTPSVLLTPVAVTKANIKDTVIKDGFLKRSDICVGKYASLCTKAGI